MKKELLLLDINLKSFDGEGGVGTSGDGGVATTQAVSQPSVQNAKAEKPTVLYGIQDDLGDGQTSTEPNMNTQGDQQLDPSAEFESLIKGQYKDQFDARIQSIIDKRFKSVKETESKLGELNPIVELLMEKYEATDMNDLRSKFEAETLEELAYKKNMDLDTYRDYREAKQLADQMKQYQHNTDIQAQIDAKVAEWYKQGDALKAEYPDFDFKEYANSEPEFLNLLQANIPVKKAYELLNLDNLKAQAAKQAQDNTVKSIQAKGHRPTEAAATSRNAPVIKSDVRSLTKEDRAEIARKVQAGETVKF